MTEEAVVARVGRVHGLRGEVTVELRTDEPDLRFADGAVLRREGGGTLTVAHSRVHHGTWLVSFREAPDRTAAEALRGTVLSVLVDPDERPEGDEEDFYDRQLIGLTVLAADGSRTGVVTEVVHLPAQDLLVIDTPAGERLVPFVRALVPEVDLAAGTAQLADVPGLLDDEEADA